MTYIKLLTVLAGLALLTACGGSSPTTPASNNTGGDTNAGGDNSGGDNSGGDNSGGDNSGGGGNAGGGGGGGNATDCTQTPFHADCLMNNAPALALRQSRCLASATADPSCVGETGIIITFCKANPFSTETDCTENPNILDFQFTSCRGGSQNPNCTELLLVNTADWVEGFTPAPNTAGDNTRTETIEFLQGTADGLNVGNILRNTVTPAETQNLKLSLLGGQAADGVAWLWNGRSANGAPPPRLAAGILAGTSLGTPFAPYTAGDTPTAIWKGRIDWHYFDVASTIGFPLTDRARVSNSGVAFDLTVNFQTRKIAAFIKRSTMPASANTDHFLIRADFDDKGRFDGTINHAAFAGSVDTGTQTNITRGELTGLIGAEGAVGAFISDYTQAVSGDTDNAFVGGFVAVPPSPCQVADNCVDTGDLPTYETKSNEIIGSGFLTATETGLNTTDLQFPVGQPRTIAIPHFIGRRGLNINNPDGFAYFTTTSPIFTPAGYAGILPTTNLGAPLAAQPANAVWAGHFSVTGSNNIATNYFVDFTNGKFGFSNDAEDDTDGELTVGTATYTMNAVFGSHASAKDEDEVRFNAGRMGGNLSVVDTGLSAVNVTITGLIGEEGAVGVFAQVGEGKGITGGFTATNPDYTPPTN